jgi:hypothetical protein
MKMEFTRRMPEYVCTCGNTLDAATADVNKSPAHGDLSLCCYCGALNQFDENLKLQPVPDDKFDGIQMVSPSDREDLIKYREMIKKSYQSRMN